MLVTVKSFNEAIMAIAGKTYGPYRQTQDSGVVLGVTEDGWNHYFIADKKYQCHFSSRLSNNVVVKIFGQYGCECDIPWLCVQRESGNAQLLKEEFCKRKINISKLHTSPHGWISWFN